MSGLAKFCLTQGKTVSGSDKVVSNVIRKLASLGASVYSGHSESNVIGAELVVYSSAIDESNPELNYAVKHKIPIVKRSELLGEILALHKRTIGISGSHGKTTVTAMISEIFIAADFNPTVFLGGERKTFGNFRLGGNAFAIAEACEYKRNFLDMRCDISVVLNVDHDHVDTYKTIDDAVSAFSAFTKNTFCILNADDDNARRIFDACTVTFGIKNLAAYRAKYISNAECRAFTVYAYGKKLGRIKLKIAGEHNVYNALAAITVATECGVPFKIIQKTLGEFDGVKRRNEYLGEFMGVACYADYAHHPTEISALLKDKTVKTLAVFQPHTYSRTAALKDDFISALRLADGIIIYKTYPAREKFKKSGDGKTLYYKIRETGVKDLSYADSQVALKTELKARVASYDKIIFIGAGDIYSIAKSVVAAQ